MAPQALHERVAIAMQEITETWNSLPVRCTRCGRAAARTIISGESRLGWCSRCKAVVPFAVLKTPAWVLGIVCLLVIRQQIVG